MRHLIVGHSFGALIVHNAIAQQLIENIAAGHFLQGPDGRIDAAHCDPGDGNSNMGKALVRGYADLIVLLNPAVEGARYEPLHEAVQRRLGHRGGNGMQGFCPGQKPVYVTITSSHDVATRYGFNVVRLLATLFESTRPHDPHHDLARQEQEFVAIEELNSSVRALGHVHRYRTHDLRSWQHYADKPETGPLHGAVVSRCPPERHGQPGCESEADRASRFYSKSVADESAASLLPGPLGTPVGRRATSRSIDVRSSDALERQAQQRTADAPPTPGEIESCEGAAGADRWLADALKQRSAGSAGPAPGWSMHFIGGSVLTQLPTYVSRETPMRELHPPGSPLWNILADDPAFIDGHGDIDGRALVNFIAQLYRSVVVRSHDTAVLDGLQQVASCEMKQCRLPRARRQACLH